jgi:hypothetical protein
VVLKFSLSGPRLDSWDGGFITAIAKCFAQTIRLATFFGVMDE